jgi:hypothetical protein
MVVGGSGVFAVLVLLSEGSSLSLRSPNEDTQASRRTGVNGPEDEAWATSTWCRLLDGYRCTLELPDHPNIRTTYYLGSTRECNAIH